MQQMRPAYLAALVAAVTVSGAVHTGAALAGSMKPAPSPHRLWLVVMEFSPRGVPGSAGVLANSEEARAWQRTIEAMPQLHVAVHCRVGEPSYRMWWYRPRTHRTIFRAGAILACDAVRFHGAMHRGAERVMRRLWQLLRGLTAHGV